MDVFVYGRRRALAGGIRRIPDGVDTAIVSIDLHQGHLADTPDCPCPAPRAREVVDGVNRFHAAARALGVPVIHVKSVLRRDGSDDVNGIKSAWRYVFPLYVGPIPNSDQHAIRGSRWTQFVTEVAETTRSCKPRSAFGLLSDRSRFPAAQHGRQAARAERLHDRLLHSQQRLRREQSRLSRHGGADLVRGTNAEMEDAALKMISLHIGLVAESRDLVAEWQRQIESAKCRLAATRRIARLKRAPLYQAISRAYRFGVKRS